MTRTEKYLKALLELQEQLNSEAKRQHFSLKEFIKDSKVDPSFIDACIKIGLIKKIKNMYIWVVGDPTFEDAEFAVELVNDYVKESQEKEYLLSQKNEN